MAGNHELLHRLSEEDHGRAPEGIGEIYPFHLAAAFLDGGHSCCAIFNELLYSPGSGLIFTNILDNMGHTVLDALMICILRSHTNVSPEHVSRSFDPPNRFPGEEKDICGRWDADSPVLRAHFRSGYARVPTKWKHGFCHTSVQAVCHSIIAVYGSPGSKINTLSGLFVRRCNNCGRELKLGPLHTLVVVAFYLAHQGMPGETMFGPLAILVCLLSLGADASLSVTMSAEDILGTARQESCHHNPMTACELMEAVPQSLVGRWSSECQTGWFCILQVLRMHQGNREAEVQRAFGDPLPRESLSDTDSDVSLEERHNTLTGIRECALEDELFDKLNIQMHGEWLEWPRGTPKLSLLWATIQVEFLTYRRIQAGDPWISDKFSMTALRNWLEGRSLTFSTPLVDDNLMRQHSPCCGWFLGCHEFASPTAENVCTQHFMNMDIYSRATFLKNTEFLDAWLGPL
ncbi:hypothetical protein MFIFM68171_07860 [Madurella fahalii]|uniref:Uncharacterized protein n=1 Tax=Madurella fahalii TaxID=1157608 RepID=A0ABQ0GIX8_9PEZI